MKNSLARSFLQVLALLTGVLVASFFRDRGNVLTNYPELSSVKASLDRGVNGAQYFLHSPASLAGGALNLGAFQGHQEVRLEKDWASAPSVTLRARGEGATHFEIALGNGGGKTVLRLSNDPLRPSAWLVADAEGTFTRKQPFPYQLPRNKWVQVELFPSGAARVDGHDLPVFGVPPSPVRLSLAGDSSFGFLRVKNLVVHAGDDAYERTFEGKIPWAPFLFATVIASLLLYLLEVFTGTQGAAGLGGALFLVLCACFALWTGPLGRRQPFSARFRAGAQNIESRESVLERLRKRVPGKAPVLLWLGGSQAWGAGASGESKTVFSRLRAEVGPLGYDWVNGAVPGSTVTEQAAAIEAVAGKLGVVVLVRGMNDSRHSDLSADLAALSAAVRARGAQLVLVPEPMEPPISSEARIRQDEVTAFAARQGFAALRVQPALDQHADDGFFWWDSVHLSDAGARFMAAALAPMLQGALGGKGSARDFSPVQGGSHKVN